MLLSITDADKINWAYDLVSITHIIMLIFM